MELIKGKIEVSGSRNLVASVGDMLEIKKCRGCGVGVPRNAPFGHCPKCLLELGFGPAQSDRSADDSDSEQMVGDYELGERIGRGGMGVVFKARQLTIQRTVALKMILGGEFACPEAIHRFQTEAEAAAKLDHPNIVPIYEFGVYRGQQYFSMKYIEGRSLAEEIRSGRFHFDGQASNGTKTDERERQMVIARLMETVARAVEYAHQHGVLHRDLKPANILLDADGQPQLMDFGLAKILEHEVGVTKTTQIMGTPGYIAPEQAAGKKLSPAADVYSLGVVLYELLTSRPPFHGATTAEILRLMAEEPAHPRLLNRQVDASLAVICLKCLEKEPADRYSTAGDLGLDLARWLGGEPIAARPATRFERGVKWVRRNRLMTALGTALLGVAVLGGWTAYDWRRGENLRSAFWIDYQRAWDDLLRGSISVIRLTSTQLAAATGKQIYPKSDAGPPMKIGIYADDDQVLTIPQLAQFFPVLEKIMSRGRSRPVEIDLFIYLRRENLESALTNGVIDIVRIGEGPLVRLRTVDRRIIPLAQQVGGGKTSVVFVPRGSPITEIAQLKGKRVAAGSRTSTSSGFRFPEMLLRLGLRSTDVKLVFHESSEKNYRLVKEGAYDAGIGRRDKLVGSLTNYFRVLAEFPATTMPWVARGGLDSGVQKAFTDALVGVKDAKILQNLPNDATEGFKVCDPADFDDLDRRTRNVEEGFFGTNSQNP